MNCDLNLPSSSKSKPRFWNHEALVQQRTLNSSNTRSDKKSFTRYVINSLTHECPLLYPMSARSQYEFRSSTTSPTFWVTSSCLCASKPQFQRYAILSELNSREGVPYA
jgi:hypothetical protein